MLSVKPVHLCSRRVGSATISVSTDLILEETTARNARHPDFVITLCDHKINFGPQRRMLSITQSGCNREMTKDERDGRRSAQNFDFSCPACGQNQWRDAPASQGRRAGQGFRRASPLADDWAFSSRR